MPRYEVTMPDANGLPVGTIVEADQVPAWLVNKCRQLPDEVPKVMEVATPHRGRPKKEKDPSE